MFQFLYDLGDWGLLALRVALGLIILAHGWPKIKNLRGTAGNFEMMGFKPGFFWGTLVAFFEVFGSLAIIFGFWTRLAALFFAIEFIIILLRIKWGQPLVGGYELDLLILGAALALTTLGAGAFSLDRGW